MISYHVNWIIYLCWVILVVITHSEWPICNSSLYGKWCHLTSSVKICWWRGQTWRLDLSFPNCKSDNIWFDSEQHQPYRVEIKSHVIVFVAQYPNLVIKGQFHVFLWGWMWEHMLVNWDADLFGFIYFIHLINHLILFIYLISVYLVFLSTELWHLLYYLV